MRVCSSVRRLVRWSVRNAFFSKHLKTSQNSSEHLQTPQNSSKTPNLNNSSKMSPELSQTKCWMHRCTLQYLFYVNKLSCSNLFIGYERGQDGNTFVTSIQCRKCRMQKIEYERFTHVQLGEIRYWRWMNRQKESDLEFCSSILSLSKYYH